MNEVVKFLEENPIQYCATVGLDNRAKVRPFQFMIEREGKLYFCTSNHKEVFKEMEKNPYIEISTASPKYQWIRINGKVKFSNDIELKKNIVESRPLLKQIYKTGENPIFEIFYLDDAKAVIADFSGNPPKEFNL